MIVFEYLYKMMDVFGPLMDDRARSVHHHVEDNMVKIVEVREHDELVTGLLVEL
jgi:hypothetical protein